MKVWKDFVIQLKQDLMALLLAYRDPRVPWYAKLWIVCILAYAFSPIDLIPDFIPIIGYLDDLLLLPLGMWLAIRMIPGTLMTEFRLQAEQQNVDRKPVYWVGAIFIILLWGLLFGYFLTIFLL